MAHDLRAEEQAFEFMKKSYAEVFRNSKEKKVTGALLCSNKLKTEIESNAAILTLIRTCRDTNTQSEAIAEILEKSECFGDFVYQIMLFARLN